MGALHWLILIPYYFFGALALLSLMILISRILRLGVRINTLVSIAMVVTVFDLAFVLTTGILSIDDFTALPMIGLFAVSLVVAFIDYALLGNLPLSLDEEMQGDDPHAVHL